MVRGWDLTHLVCTCSFLLAIVPHRTVININPSTSVLSHVAQTYLVIWEGPSPLAPGPPRSNKYGYMSASDDPALNPLRR
ncbi:hypothetical protein EV356DRAFT_507735, partial [Viridothelium virens]